MEIVQGYAILKTTTFDSGHGFALGHNPGAPDPFVTWQFTEGEKGQRDYYWGRYGNSLEWAQRDFDRRVDDYQHLYHVANGRLMAWGELTYAKPLTEKQMEDYELKPAPANPDRVRPSITARLKDAARGQEPPKEPSQKRGHKNHEER